MVVVHLIFLKCFFVFWNMISVVRLVFPLRCSSRPPAAFMQPSTGVDTREKNESRSPNMFRGRLDDLRY